MKAQWVFISILFFALLTAIFAAINTEPVKVHLIFADMQLPLIIIILSSTLLGGLMLGLIGVSKQYRLKRTIKQLEKQLNEAQMANAVAPSQPPISADQLPATYAGSEKSPSTDL